MSLRGRLVTGLVMVLVLVTGLAIAVVAVQRGQLIDQLDQQLMAIAPLERPAQDAAAPPPSEAGVRGAEREPISDIYIAAVGTNATVEVIVEGQLLDDVPDTSRFVAEAATERSFVTIDSIGDSNSFRVLVDPTPGGDASLIIAIPMTDVDQTIDRLITTFALVALAIAGTLGAVAWWVWQLGIRPLTRMTDTADAIASGDRGQRVPELSDTTEAGQLANALNTMLDQRDEAEDRLRQFVSDASHELRTPLTSIRGYLELYSNGGFREPGQLDDVVRRMTDESDRMAALVESLLHLARLDEEQPLVMETVDVGELVRDTCADALMAQPGRDITADAPERGELYVDIDRQKVRQMLSGLVENATVHGPEASVEVRAHRSPDELLLSVVDDGPGLSPAEAERVFDRFYRADGSRSRLRGGSGLGLAIARLIAQRHGGDIDLTTAPGQGCTFTIRIPVLPSAPRPIHGDDVGSRPS